MKIKDVMTPEPKTCTTQTSLATAAHLMLEGDCGILPIVDDGKIAGVVTDRDMYIALATRNKLASQIAVSEVGVKTVFTCEPEDDVHLALEMMKEQHVRRLPVVGFGGTVIGIVSMNDLAIAAGPRKQLRDAEVFGTMQAICAHHLPVPHVVAT